MIQHLSIRVPWKDNGYTGLVCDRPCYNTACMKLKNIAENKNDSFEDKLAGCSIKGHEEKIPCLSECGCFMSAESYTKIINHPYKKNNSKTHGHFLETKLTFPSYSFVARPFAWTMLEKQLGSGKKQTIEQLADEKGIDYDSDNEPNLGFKTNWVQTSSNQREIFKTFYKNIIPHQSLAIAYAKQVPFVEDAKRVVIGIGHITSITNPPEYNHTDASSLRSVLWETMLGHSIREDKQEGFLLPYREMMEYAKEHSDFDITSIVVFVDDENFSEFSYATEQVSYDAVINILLKTIKSLRIIKNCIPGNWNDCINWCKRELEKVWLERGSYPGLGAMLTAVGFTHGNLVAEEIRDKIDDICDYETKVYQLLENSQEIFSNVRAKDITQTKFNAFKTLPEERKKLFWLLARVNINKEQAVVLFNQEERQKLQIICSDNEILENPYILYEKTRMCPEDYQLSVNKIDMAIFPPDILAKKNPLKDPVCLEDADDKRRIRALAINVLEQQTANGHTVYPKTKFIDEINNLPIEPECQVTSDVIDSIKNFLDEEIKCIECEDKTDAFQLTRLYEIDSYIRKTISERLASDRFKISENWAVLVNSVFKDNTIQDEKETAARTEKTAVVQELASSPISVLIGGAGTGKTTVLSILCKSEKIKKGGILLLAPTGKARVRMSKTMSDQGVKHTAMTVAQFLIKNKQFNWNTMQYSLSNKVTQNVPETVIIDECSMMTEEMFGATLSALTSASRIIFVGDPSQLPPIGAGRPFVDLVRFLKHDLPKYPNPQVCKGFGELTITRRQADNGISMREDIALSLCFADKTSAPIYDNLFANLQNNTLGCHIKFKQWSTPEDLQKQVFETICEETEMKDINDIEGFYLSLGGTINNGWMNFGNQIKKLDSWQILSAYKSEATIGTSSINRYIHEKYCSHEYLVLPNSKKRSTKHLLGTDGIVFGDKVINIRNTKKNGYPNDAESFNYVANGEVGIVERLWEKPKAKANTHQIRFSSQPNYNYNWFSTIGEETNDIELAYALTVHKVQGSEFDTVILVLNEPSRMISRELLYTALTRQKNKIIILYNDEAYKLKKYASVEFSDIAQRFTCLFEAPKIVEYQKKFYEDKLIHKTSRGELVRSKSEVIIANLLNNAGLDYTYEEELVLADGSKKYPDFVIRKNGKIFYWEHLGMLQKEDYAKLGKQEETIRR